VQNGGFETGDFTGWTRSGNTAFTSVTTGSSYIHSGADGLRAGPSGALGFLSQTLPTVAGKTYFISCWLDNPKAGTPNKFRIFWDGNIYFDQTNLPALGWTTVHFLATATTSSTVLQFGFQHDPAYFGFDDVSVTPVSSPLIKTLTKTNTTMQFTWDNIAGLTYQAQYRTNLAQGIWQNFGVAISSTNLTPTITDTAIADSQRFYRIVVLP
jgi:hypothetical protein